MVCIEEVHKAHYIVLSSQYYYYQIIHRETIVASLNHIAHGATTCMESSSYYHRHNDEDDEAGDDDGAHYYPYQQHDDVVSGGGVEVSTPSPSPPSWTFVDTTHISGNSSNNTNNNPPRQLSRDNSIHVTDEVFNSISHLSAAMISFLGMVLLIAQSGGNAWKIVSFSIYGSSLLFLFCCSTLHHAISGSVEVSEWESETIWIEEHIQCDIYAVSEYSNFSMNQSHHIGTFVNTDGGQTTHARLSSNIPSHCRNIHTIMSRLLS